MKHYKDNDSGNEIHEGAIAECDACNADGSFDEGEFDEDELLVPPSDPEPVSPDGSSVIVGSVAALPTWMPPAATDDGAPPKPAGPSLIVGNPDNDDGSLPTVIETALPPTSKLPAGARKRWNVAALTGPDQTVFDVRRGDGPVEFQVVGSKQSAIDVIVALSLVDRTDRNAMRVALMANPEIASKLPDIGDQFSKSEEAKGAEFLSWLRKRGRSMLENGSRPWHGKIEGGPGAKPPTMATLLAKLAGGGTN